MWSWCVYLLYAILQCISIVQFQCSTSEMKLLINGQNRFTVSRMHKKTTKLKCIDVVRKHWRTHIENWYLTPQYARRFTTLNEIQIEYKTCLFGLHLMDNLFYCWKRFFVLLFYFIFSCSFLFFYNFNWNCLKMVPLKLFR